MNTRIQTSADSEIPEGAYISVCTGLSSDALPKVENSSQSENSDTGVSTHFVPLPKEFLESRRTVRQPHWYALRVTYGREKKAYDYLVGKNVEAFYPTIKTVKKVDGKRKTVEESRLPNIFFARGTEEEIKSFVYDNINLPYLRFYYKHTHTGARIMKTPLIVPDNQIKSLQIICEKEGSDTLILQEEVEKFQKGEKVRIIEGDFVGVTGIVARYHGQQRVGLVIDGLLTAVTAYIPTAFLEKII